MLSVVSPYKVGWVLRGKRHIKKQTLPSLELQRHAIGESPHASRGTRAEAR